MSGIMMPMPTPSLKNSFPAPPPSQQEVDEFVTAAGKGDMVVVTAFLDKHITSINQKGPLDHTAMTKAAAEGQKEMVELLLKKGAQIDARDNYNWTPLIYAAQRGRTPIVALLLEKGAQIGATAQQGWTALMWAARFGYTGTVRILLEKGAEIGAVNTSGMTALKLAMAYKHGETAELIEQWPELQRQRQEQERKNKERELAEIKARELNAERLEKLKNQRPPKPPLKKKR